MNILIPGGSGLIGRRLVERLQQDHRVTVLSRTAKASSATNAPGVQVDLAEKSHQARLDEALKSIDVVVNLASQQPRRNLTWADYEKGNCTSIANLLAACKAAGVSKLVHVSTSAFLEFPEGVVQELTENAHVQSQNEYGLSKYAGEEIVRLNAVPAGIRAVILRLPSVFAEEQEGGVLDTYVASAQANRDLELYSEGRYSRSLVYIDDVVEAIVRSMAHLSGRDLKPGCEVYNIANEPGVRLLDLAKQVYERVGSQAKVVPVKTEVPIRGHWVLSVEKAKKDLRLKLPPFQERLELYLKNKIGVSR